VNEQRDGRSPFALAMEWTSRITTISLEMVVPPAIGYWLDRRLGTGVLFLILGMIAGFTTAMFSLVKLTRPPGPDNRAG
jgi:F0F1-type ATP synthase assembly protein I